MPIVVDFTGLRATYRNGRWECEDERIREILEANTQDTVGPSDPLGLGGVEEAMWLLGGEIVEVVPVPIEPGRIY